MRPMRIGAHYWSQDHSAEEDRLVAVGQAGGGVIVVVFTERTEDTIRLISARHATRGEASLYREYMGIGR